MGSHGIEQNNKEVWGYHVCTQEKRINYFRNVVITRNNAVVSSRLTLVIAFHACFARLALKS